MDVAKIKASGDAALAQISNALDDLEYSPDQRPVPLLRLAMDYVRDIIAELGQEVGAVGFVDIHGVARWYRPKGVSKQPEKGSLLFTSPPSSKPNAPAAWMVELNGEIVTLTDDAEEASSDARRFGARVVPLYTSPAHTSEARDGRAIRSKAALLFFAKLRETSDVHEADASVGIFEAAWHCGTNGLVDALNAALDAAMRQEGGNG
jgi:hypothetical protein